MKYSSRGIKNEWNIGDDKPKTMKIEHKVPKNKEDAIKFARKEIKEWFKFLKKLQIQSYCPCCNADLPIKLPKNWGK